MCVGPIVASIQVGYMARGEWDVTFYQHLCIMYTIKVGVLASKQHASLCDFTKQVMFFYIIIECSFVSKT